MAVATFHIHLGESVKSLDDLLVVAGDLFLHLRPHESVGERLGEPRTAPAEGPTDLHARGGGVDPHQGAISKARVRDHAADVDVPMVIAGERQDIGDRTRDSAEFRRVRNGVDLNGIDDAQRKLEGELPGHGVGGIDAVHEQRALTRAGAIETKAPLGITDDAGQEWQGLLKSIGLKLKDPQELLPDLVLLDGLASARRGDHIDDLRQGGQGQREPYVDRLTFTRGVAVLIPIRVPSRKRGLTLEHQDGRMHAARVPGQFGRHDVRASRQGVEHELSGLAGDRGGDDAGGWCARRSSFDRVECDGDAGQDMSRRIEDRPADERGLGLGMTRQGTGGPEPEEAHEPEQPTPRGGKDTAHGYCQVEGRLVEQTRRIEHRTGTLLHTGCRHAGH